MGGTGGIRDGHPRLAGTRRQVRGSHAKRGVCSRQGRRRCHRKEVCEQHDVEFLRREIGGAQQGGSETATEACGACWAWEEGPDPQGPGKVWGGFSRSKLGKGQGGARDGKRKVGPADITTLPRHAIRKNHPSDPDHDRGDSCCAG